MSFAIINTVKRKVICVVLSVLLVLVGVSFALSSAAVASPSAGGEIISGLLVDVSADRSSYMAGDTATFEVTVTNNTGKKIEKNTLEFTASFEDKDLNAAVQSQLPETVISSEIKKDEKYTFEYVVTFPEDQYSLSTNFNLHASYTSGYTSTLDLSIPVVITSKYSGIAVKSATDAGTQLSSKTTTYAQDKLAVKFDMANYDGKRAETNPAYYDFSLKVVGYDKVGGTATDLTEDTAFTVTWDPAFPNTKSKTAWSENDISTCDALWSGTVNITFKPEGAVGKDKYTVYTVSLTTTDKSISGNEVTKSISFYRKNINLNFTWTIPYYSDKVYSGDITKFSGTDWFNNLYYDNVARDSRVPFSNASELIKYLENSETETEAQNRLNEYIYDLYDPHTYGLTKLEGDYGDSVLYWPKDSYTPFHSKTEKSSSTPMETFSAADSGVSYDENYVTQLGKSAGPDLGDNNTERTYSISLSATPYPVAVVPHIIAFMVPTHWHTFDVLHAEAQKKVTERTEKGSILTHVDSMANLYDVKNAILRFAKFLKDEGSNTALAFVNTQHDGDYSLLKNGYYTTNLDAFQEALRLWDTFGDCEHVHWSTETLAGAIDNISTELGSWKDADNVDVTISDIVKTVIAIGGATENDDGENGYGATLVDKKLDWSKINSLFGIRTVKGISHVSENGRPIYSWLDTIANQGTIKSIDEKYPWYTKIDDPDNPAYQVATSEDELYNALVNIYNNSGVIKESADHGLAESYTISDTVSDEFEVTSVVAQWGSVSGSWDVYTWTPDDPDDHFDVITNEDGTTSVTCKYGDLKGKGMTWVLINVKAKDDFLGSNNVLTNSTTPTAGWSHTKFGVTKTFSKNFTETPSVNVPILELPAIGGKDIDVVNTTFDLADYADVSFDDFTLYDQINGKVKLSWWEDKGGGVKEKIPDSTEASYKVTNGAFEKGVTPSVPSCEVVSSEPTTKNYFLKLEFEPDEATNDKEPVSATEAKSIEAKINITWINTIGLTIQKVDSVSKNPLSGVHFCLRKDDDDGKFDPTKDPLASVYSDKECKTKVEGPLPTDDDGKLSLYGITPNLYWIQETATRSGYQLISDAYKLRVDDECKAYLTVPGGEEQEVTLVDNIAQITIENEPTPSLPVTGLNLTLLLYGIGALVLMGIACYKPTRRYKRTGCKHGA